MTVLWYKILKNFFEFVDIIYYMRNIIIINIIIIIIMILILIFDTISRRDAPLPPNVCITSSPVLW